MCGRSGDGRGAHTVTPDQGGRRHSGVVRKRFRERQSLLRASYSGRSIGFGVESTDMTRNNGVRASRPSGLAIGRGLAVLALFISGMILPDAQANPTPDQTVAALNTWRTELGEGTVSTTTVPSWNTGCNHHNNYENLNGNEITHAENAGNPGYTSDGAEAGSDSLLSTLVSGLGQTPDSSLLPGPTWDAAVFQRAALLEPRLSRIGFNSSAFASVSSYQSFNCLWLLNQNANPPQAIDNGQTTPALALYPSPGNGAYHVPTTFPAGTESPDPATETGVPVGAALGWLMNVELNGPWTSDGYGYLVYAHGVTATLAPDGTTNFVPLVVSQCGPSGCGGSGGSAEGLYFKGGFGIFPTQPLAPDTVYRVVLTGGTVTDSAAHVDYPIPQGYSWCFSTGATYNPSADCAPPTAAAEEPANVNANTTLSLGNGSGSLGGANGSSGGSNKSSGAAVGGSPFPGRTSSSTGTLTATAGNQRITVSVPVADACVAASRPLTVSVRASRISGSKGHSVRFIGGVVFIDRGVRRAHGTHVSYVANHAITALPETAHIKLTGYRSGSHTLMTRLLFHQIVHAHGHSRTVAISRPLQETFRIC
jgi:hypothetical protein